MVATRNQAPVHVLVAFDLTVLVLVHPSRRGAMTLAQKIACDCAPRGNPHRTRDHDWEASLSFSRYRTHCRPRVPLGSVAEIWDPAPPKSRSWSARHSESHWPWPREVQA